MEIKIFIIYNKLYFTHFSTVKCHPAHLKTVFLYSVFCTHVLTNIKVKK